MQKSDLFIIPGNTIHRAFPDKDEPVTSSALFLSPLLVEQPSLGESFTYMQCFDQIRKNRVFKMECSVELQIDIENILNHIEAELRLQKLGYRHALLLNTQRLLLEINRNRNIGKQQKGHSAFKGSTWVSSTSTITSRRTSVLAVSLTGMNVTRFINV